MSNLSQLQFPGMGSNLPSFSVQGKNPKHEVRDDYTSAHGYDYDDDPVATPYRSWEPNGLPPTDALHHPGPITNYGPEREEWVPTERLRSNQTGVNPKAVDHMVKNANPLALDSQPYAFAYEDHDGRESYEVRDGNHRANAALRRGQLLMPAGVRRPIAPGTDVRTLLPNDILGSD